MAGTGACPGFGTKNLAELPQQYLYRYPGRENIKPKAP